MTVKDFCAPLFDRLIPVLACLGTMGFLFGILIALYFRYEHEIKVWLFAHKLLLWLFREDMDSEKEFDAFVSFSNEDEDYVINSLIPGLENNFKICYHMRDFLPGQWIHTQIQEYIEKSRRTIIVLSENFLRSQWALLEFRTAHAQAVKDNCSRVIILIYGDMPSQENMEPDMKAYMKTHTYIKSSDDWFWHKLRYALPHGPSKPTDKIAMTPVSDISITIKSDFIEPSRIFHSPEIMKKG